MHARLPPRLARAFADTALCVGCVDDKARREELLACDGARRAVYPQLFLRCLASETDTFAADLDVFESAVECSGLPSDVLRSNPDIQTFDSIFYDLKYVGWRATQRAAEQCLWLVAGTQHLRLGRTSPLYILPLDIVAMVAKIIQGGATHEAVATPSQERKLPAPAEEERRPYGSRIVL